MRDGIRTGVQLSPSPYKRIIDKRYRINHQIRVTPIRVIGEDGTNLGVMETSEALKRAIELGLDLIEIAATVQPPVCRIMDFGKFKYEREKGERERGKKQKDVEIKGIRIGFMTGRHDLERYALKIKEFLIAGDKVRVEMRLHGREKAHKDLALQKFEEFLSIIPAEFKLDAPPKRLPQGYIAVVGKK